MSKPKCDFCSSQQVVWAYPCEDFAVMAVMFDKRGEEVAFPWGSDGPWAACEICAALIEEDRWDDLAQRSVDTSSDMRAMEDMMARGEVKKSIKGLHSYFRKLRSKRVPV